MTDEMDRRIITLLNQDGRAAYKDIAARLDVSEGTIRNRINRLLEDGRLRVMGAIDPDLAPSKQLVLLGIRIACSKDLSKKAEEIARLDGVLALHLTTGRFDILAELWLDAKVGLIQFLGQTLAQIDGIVSTESFLAMKSFNKWIPQSDL